MGILDSLFGNKDEQNVPSQTQPAQQARPQNADEQALARYRYMLQTAPPEQLEAAHAEAFARLTPEQRQMALQQMAGAVPENERAGLSDDPRALARAATRAEVRQPGTLERLMGNRGNANGGAMGGGMMGGGMMGGGMMGGMGAMMAGSLLTSLAGGFIGSSIAHSFFSDAGHEQAFQDSPEAANVDGGASDYNAGDFEQAGLSSDADPMGDPGLEQGNDFNDAGATETSYDDAGGYDAGGYDDGGAFDAGGFDGGGMDFGGDF